MQINSWGCSTQIEEYLVRKWAQVEGAIWIWSIRAWLSWRTTLFSWWCGWLGLAGNPNYPLCPRCFIALDITTQYVEGIIHLFFHRDDILRGDPELYRSGVGRSLTWSCARPRTKVSPSPSSLGLHFPYHVHCHRDCSTRESQPEPAGLAVLGSWGLMYNEDAPSYHQGHLTEWSLTWKYIP